ncbi:NmrA family NAD(P)-binding protein [Actinoplanes sp. NPDC049802]|uniref:SDR family oxidoreductase n=1 Tax=Actinoplanes sp. NPDC049802 TaxID=3154742 RepID=UPI00340B2E2A
MSHLVFGATGAQGGAIARALAERGHPVRGCTRRAATGRLAVPVTTGDLGDRGDVGRLFDGVTHAVLTLPLVYDPDTVAGYARNVAEAARAAGVQRLVFNTNTSIPDRITPYAAFETRRAAEAILRDSGVPLVVLRPPVYLDNLLNPAVGAGIVDQGVLAYPLPADRRVAWLSHTDLAAAALAALETPGIDGQTVDVGGAEVVTGAELAAIIGRVVNRNVTYLPLEPEIFERGLAQAIGAEAASGVAGLYKWASDPSGRDLYDVDPASASRVLGFHARPIAEWAAAQPWRQWARAASTSKP